MRRLAPAVVWMSLLAAALAAGAGCKKKKPPVEPEAGEVFEPAAERAGSHASQAPSAPPGRGPTRSTHPVSVGTPPVDPAADRPTAAPAAAPAGTPQPEAAAGGEGSTGMIPASGSREAAAKAPPELVDRGEVAVGKPDVGDDRSAADIATLISRVRTPIASCLTRAQRDNPDLTGTTTFDLTIDPRGVVSSWTADGSIDPTLTECVANRLRGLRFGTTESETHVRVPIRFSRP